MQGGSRRTTAWEEFSPNPGNRHFDLMFLCCFQLFSSNCILKFPRAMDQDSLRCLWLHGQEGRLSPWEQARALGLREASRDLYAPIASPCMLHPRCTKIRERRRRKGKRSRDHSRSHRRGHRRSRRGRSHSQSHWLRRSICSPERYAPQALCAGDQQHPHTRSRRRPSAWHRGELGPASLTRVERHLPGRG